jgi:hypothetical protein
MLATLDCDRIADGTELVRSEYAEMPGLCLTEAQMARLFGFDAETLDEVLDVLLRARILRRTYEGSYVAFDSAR